ncbi:MAG: symmetrical bis(5'-nucleosyl)-tetraphosphatase [Pseudomonadota bacterium]
MTRWAIGDIQGCLEPFDCLLEKIRFMPGRDTLWLVGDLVNRGPDSLGVLRRLYGLREHCRIVLGNHDLHLLAVARNATPKRRKDTFDDVLSAPDRDLLLDWLQQQPLLQYDERDGTVLTHAGIPPQWSLFDARRLAREVEDTLRSRHALAFFADMYGNEPAGWSETLTGTTRLRTITNYFTRMRFIDANGALDLTSKEGAGTAPPGFVPWFSAANRRCEAQRIVFGHWAALEGRIPAHDGVQPNVHAIDTGCVWGYTLTAMNLDTGERTGCDCPRPASD